MNKPLSTRELDIVELIFFGLTEKEIANYLKLSEWTVKTHKRNIFNKTGSRNIADVARWFYQHKVGISLTPSDKFKAFVSTFLLILVIAGEFILSSQFIRPVRTRNIEVITRTSSRRRKEESSYYLTA